ncbi:MAG: hypothetical protein VB110_10675 [Bacteroidales bacterium]|nr:hypothetical protein [Bacteroidales bacterium]
MRTTIKSTEKKVYRSPQIERNTLDNEISLTLESPALPPVWSENQESATNNLFKTNVG